MSRTAVKADGKAWSNFQDTETAPQTKKIYAKWVRTFMIYCGITDPEKLLKLGTVHDIEDRVISWLGTLKDRGKATATVRTALAGLVFFLQLQSNEIRWQVHRPQDP